MFTKSLDSFADDIIKGKTPSKNELFEILCTEKKDFLSLLYITDKIRYHFFRNKVGLCSILNAKSGNCSEDCSFCSQSLISKASIKKYPMKSCDEITVNAFKISKFPVGRLGIVTSGKTLGKKDMKNFLNCMDYFPETHLSCCVSFGLADTKMLEDLKNAGVKRYHHNLETAESLFDKICTTHKYNQRIETVKKAKKTGLKVCSGGIFGLGETDEQIIEFAQTLKEINPDSIPVNFLVPVKGTATEDFSYLTPYKCILIIALLRIMLPDKEIIICGGRSENLREFLPFIFYAGVSNLMTGDYLTTSGEAFENDLRWLKQLGFYPETAIC